VLIDAHAHVDRYGDALPAALREIERHQIFTLSNSMGLESYQRNLEIAAECSWVLPIFGVHPWNAVEYATRLEDLREAIATSPMLGEIGLDHYFVKDSSEYPAQRTVFEFFLAAAKGQSKVVHLHTKGAEAEVLDLLRQFGLQRMVVHWYSGPLDTFRELLALGAYFTVGVEMLYSEHIRTIARELPVERLLTETDNPGGPKSLIGRLGMPALIQDVVEGLADLREMSTTAIEQAVQANLARLTQDDLCLPGA
jgi:TatD DNase family protein